MTDDPRRLLASYRAGDAVAVEALAARALRIALRTARAMLRDRELAEDVAQDVAVEVLRGVGRLRLPETLDAWIHRIAVRHTMRLITKTRRRAGTETSLDAIPEALHPESAGSPQESAEHAALAAAVADALETLPSRQRMALVLRYVHDMTLQQIADTMEIRIGTAGGLVSRGRETLRGRQAFDVFSDAGGGAP